MKNLLMIGLVFCSFGYAAPKDDGKFAEAKQHMTKRLDEEIEGLQKAKSCVDSASDAEGLKKCHEAMEKAHKQRKAADLDHRIEELKKEKEKLEKD